MNKIILFILAVLAISIVACSQQTIQQPVSVPAIQSKTEKSDSSFVAPSVSIVSAPSSIKQGTQEDIVWRVDGSASTIPSTAIHYDVKSHPGNFDIQTTPPDVGYMYIINNFLAGKFEIPRTFQGKIVGPMGATKIYYRVHAIINGENIWSEEAVIPITK